MVSVESIKMRVLITVIFWTVAAVLVIPAVLGIFAGIAVIAAVLAVGFVLALLALTTLVVCCVPLLWWFVAFDTAKIGQYVNRVQVAMKAQAPAAN